MSKAPPTSYTHTYKAESPSCFIPGVDIPQEIPNTATAITVIVVIVVLIRAFTSLPGFLTSEKKRLELPEFEII